MSTKKLGDEVIRWMDPAWKGCGWVHVDVRLLAEMVRVPARHEGRSAGGAPLERVVVDQLYTCFG